MKQLVLNPGQEAFVNDTARYPGFVGGVGSGKTFCGVLRGIMWSQQPKVPGRAAPRGGCFAIHHRELEDVVIPEFLELVEGTDLLVDYQKSKKKAIMKGGGEILFRSLDNPNWMRGLNLSWFFIDEARLVTKKSWDVLIARLRQPGYNHSGWVATTSNGYDWVYDLFHEDGENHIPGRYVLHRAKTEDNKANLPAETIEDLYANYSDEHGNLTLFGEQELLGKFVGIAEGGVFRWRPSLFEEFNYNPSLPLYGGWDFGVGDPGVLTFAQIEWLPKSTNAGRTIWVPKYHLLAAIEHEDLGADAWAEVYKSWLAENIPGNPKVKNYGDPAGKQRAMSGAGTSVIDDLLSAGIDIEAAPKKPQDYAIRIQNNLMDANRFRVNRTLAKRAGQAFASSQWKLDKNGRRIGTAPIHNWTSHYTTSNGYLISGVLGFHGYKTRLPAKKYTPGSAGDIKQAILTGKRPKWRTPVLGA